MTVVYPFSGLPQDLADASDPSDTTTLTITLPDIGTITDLKIRMFMRHSALQDMRIYLASPDAWTVLVYDGPNTTGLFAGGSTNFGASVEDPLILSADATLTMQDHYPPTFYGGTGGEWLPTGDLTEFNGRNTEGVWTIFFEDAFPGLGAGGVLARGHLEYLSLAMTATDEPPEEPPEEPPMSANRIYWDQPGERTYFTGLDHGVLYPQVGIGHAWNGLVSVASGASREVKSYYMDGVKYLDHEVLGEWQGKLTAFTYPDILDELLGIYRYAPGVFAHDQPSQTFNLSYRTQVGNDLEGDEAGHIIHVLFNLRAIPDEVTHVTRGAQTDPLLFSWTLTSTPPAMYGIRPTAHISIDLRKLPSILLTDLENTLYGSDSQPAVLAGKDIAYFLNLLKLDP